MDQVTPTLIAAVWDTTEGVVIGKDKNLDVAVVKVPENLLICGLNDSLDATISHIRRTGGQSLVTQLVLSILCDINVSSLIAGLGRIGVISDEAR